METFLLLPILILYMVYKYYETDHETPAEKDRKRFKDGIDLLKAKKFDESHDYFDEAIKHYPDSALAYLYRGKSNLGLGNYYSAVYDLSTSGSLDNTNAECYYLKGMALFELEEFEPSFREFDKAVWYYRNADAEAMRWRAMARYKLGQAEQAEKDLERAVTLGDENAAGLLRKLRQQKIRK